MPRTLSSGLLSDINSNTQTDPLVALIEIVQTDISTLRFCRNTSNLVSNGDTYTAFPFDITLPKADDQGPPEVALVIDNVDRQLVTAARSMTSNATLTLSLVLVSDPDTVEVGPFAFKIRNIKYTRQFVEATLGFNNAITTRFPTERISANNFPAAVKQ